MTTTSHEPQPACASLPPAIADQIFFSATDENTAKAKKVCSHCPLRPECLETINAIETKDCQPMAGIWAGLTPLERAPKTQTGIACKTCAHCGRYIRPAKLKASAVPGAVAVAEAANGLCYRCYRTKARTRTNQSTEGATR